MNFVQMVTGLLTGMQQLDASSQGVRCHYLRGTAGEQKMANLPTSRVEPAPPFSFCAVDCFGPWYVKEGRREVKRHGTLFTCMASRAIHIEVAHSMETDSFLQALRRVIARRGPIRELRSDQGTNFVGVENELKSALQEMDDEKIKAELLKHNIDWVRNPATASNFGGAWERQISTEHYGSAYEATWSQLRRRIIANSVM